MSKQNDKESARDMTGYKPSNFDSSFKAGKGWGDLGVSCARTHTTRKKKKKPKLLKKLISTRVLFLLFPPPR